MNKRGFVFALVGCLLIITAVVAPVVVAKQATLLQEGKLLTTKISAFGRLVPWRYPSYEFQKVLNAQALELGFERQPDGTFKRVG